MGADGLDVIPAGLKVALNFYATNLPGNRYQAAYARMRRANCSETPSANTPCCRRPAGLRKPLRTPVATRKASCSIPLQTEIGGAFGALAYGFRTALDSPSSTTEFDRHRPGDESRRFRTVVSLERVRARAASSATAHRLHGVARYALSRRRVERDDIAGAVRVRNARKRPARRDFRGVDLERCYAGGSGERSSESRHRGDRRRRHRDRNDSGVQRRLARSRSTRGWTSGAPLSRGTSLAIGRCTSPASAARLPAWPTT